MSETLIIVENVSKKFCRNLKQSLFYGLQDLGNELIGKTSKEKIHLRKNEFWAADNVSFEVKRGECLGLIGRNGAGKSTLLKMLNGLIKPDKGRIEMKGRVGALIELGAGFNPILTGRENIFVNGAVLGMSKKEINGLFDQIVEFSELGDFIETPVQYYSSGMKVRLGFAIASQIRPDVLLIDEVLAVGDMGFKAKCYNEIFKILENSAVIFVSHSMPQVAKVCTTGLLLEKGSIKLRSNNISEVIYNYFNLFDGEKLSLEGSKKIELKKIGIGNEELTVFLNPTQDPPKEIIQLNHQKKIRIYLQFAIIEEVKNFSILIGVIDGEQKLVSQMVSPILPPQKPGDHKEVEIEIDNAGFNTGNYSLSIHFLGQGNQTEWGETYLGVRNILRFGIRRERFVGSAPIIKDCNWTLKDVI